MKTGTGFPEQFTSISRMHYAGLSRQEKSPEMVTSQTRLKFIEVAAYMRRLFGTRRDVLIAQEADKPSMGEKNKECA